MTLRETLIHHFSTLFYYCNSSVSFVEKFLKLDFSLVQNVVRDTAVLLQLDIFLSSIMQQVEIQLYV